MSHHTHDIMLCHATLRASKNGSKKDSTHSSAILVRSFQEQGSNRGNPVTACPRDGCISHSSRAPTIYNISILREETLTPQNKGRQPTSPFRTPYSAVPGTSYQVLLYVMPETRYAGTVTFGR